MTKDSYLGECENPLSLNLYSYVENNPVKYVDPCVDTIVNYNMFVIKYKLQLLIIILKFR